MKMIKMEFEYWNGIFKIKSRYAGDAEMSTESGRPAGSVPADAPQPAAGGAGSENDVRSLGYHRRFYRVLGAAASNKSSNNQIMFIIYSSITIRDGLRQCWA